jgi:hypothetical protein
MAFAAVAPIIAAVIPFLLQSIFGKKDEEKQTQETTTPPKGYESPILGLQDPIIASLLAQNVQRYQGFGMPGGAGLDTSMISGLLQKLNSQFPDLLAGYTSGPKKLREGRPAAGGGKKPSGTYK